VCFVSHLPYRRSLERHDSELSVRNALFGDGLVADPAGLGPRVSTDGDQPTKSDQTKEWVL
jgi:hypothetical protein